MVKGSRRGPVSCVASHRVATEHHGNTSNEHNPMPLSNNTIQPNQSVTGDVGNHGSAQSEGSASPETLYTVLQRQNDIKRIPG